MPGKGALAAARAEADQGRVIGGAVEGRGLLLGGGSPRGPRHRGQASLREEGGGQAPVVGVAVGGRPAVIGTFADKSMLVG